MITISAVSIVIGLGRSYVGCAINDKYDAMYINFQYAYGIVLFFANLYPLLSYVYLAYFMYKFNQYLIKQNEEDGDYEGSLILRQ